MTTLDVSTEDWTLWAVVLRSPDGTRCRQVSVRCPAEADAPVKALSAPGFAGWRVADDAYGNPLIWREALG